MSQVVKPTNLHSLMGSSSETFYIGHLISFYKFSQFLSAEDLNVIGDIYHKLMFWLKTV